MLHSTSTACPEHSELLALAEGRLTETVADAVSLHVSACVACDARLEQIEEISDPLIQALASLPATDDDEPTFQELQSKLLSSPESFSGTVDFTHPANFFESDGFTTPLPAQSQLPFLLGNYELLEQIGAGAHGAVFRARHRRLEREVAVKLLLRARGPFVDEFLNEMRVIGKLDHPNIIRATDAGEHDGIYFLVMDYVPGLDVSSLLRRTGPLKVADACEIARQTALGLAFAHEHNLVHRDVKTSNLLFSSSGKIKLLDLGLATIPSRIPNQIVDTTSPGSTDVVGTTSGPRGTSDYMPPEQWLEASRVTHKADLYSLGCTLFKLLTGEPPFKVLPPGMTDKQQAHERAEPPRLSAYRDDVPESVERLVRQLLAKNVADRPESAQTVAEMLSKPAAAADFERITIDYCPELEPQHIETSASRQPATLSSKLRHFSNRIPRRTWFFGIVTLVSAAAFFLATLPRETPPVVDVEHWRTLTPSTPVIVQLPETDQDPQLVTHDAGQFEFQSTTMTLVHLGSPMKKPFRWRTAFHRSAKAPGTAKAPGKTKAPGTTKAASPTEGANAKKETRGYGVFFRMQKNKAKAFQFQSIEVFANARETRLVWCAYQQPDQIREPLVLAETDLRDILNNADGCELEIVVGRAGFPEVSINGKSVPEPEWVLSAEARDIAASNVEQLEKVYSGRIGVLHQGGFTKIESSKLLYLNR